MIFNEILSLLSSLSVPSVEKTKEYIRSWNSLRLFICNGPGFGDQVFGTNTLEYLMFHVGLHQKKIPIEIIVPTVNVAEEFNEQALFKVATLLGIEVSKNTTYLNSTSSTGISFSLMTFEHFLKLTKKEVDVAIFGGVLPMVQKSFPLSSNLDFTKLAFAKKSFYFNPFSYVIPNGVMDAAAAMQKKGMETIGYPTTKDLTYHLPFWNELPVDAVINEMNIYHKINPLGATYLEKILALKKTNSANLFPIYGLNRIIRKFPEEIILNLILAANKALPKNQKPLFFLLLNKIYPDTWNKLETLMSNSSTPLRLSYAPNFKNAISSLKKNVRFCHENNTDTCFTNLGANDFVVLSANDVPNHLFRYIFGLGDLPSVYEGVNSVAMLATDEKFGLPCKKHSASLTEWSVLNPSQRAATSLLCEQHGDALLWNQHPKLSSSLAMIMNELNSTTPASIPENQNRLLYMAEQMRELEECDIKPNQIRCTSYNPSVLSIGRVTGGIAATHFGYGIFEGLTYFGARSLKMKPGYASFISSVMRVALQSQVEEYSNLMTAFLLLPSFLDLIADQDSSLRRTKEAYKAAVVFLYFLSFAYNLNSNYFLVSLLLFTSVAIPDVAGRKLVSKLTEKKEESAQDNREVSSVKKRS